ncbi:MAG: LLM class flavin-dependent oxidoreductase, partial [Kutzneria sp.]|nr:LLM class flavin-dependent oxidoreductase [Kutzneria sp.]
MRFAIKSSQMCARWSDPLALWKEADDIDIFESGWIFDHLYPTFGDLTAPCLESWTTLAALAQATRRIRLGILVSGVHFRHPAVLAKMTSTVDIISGGRVELGVGAGWNLQECEAY